MDGHGSPAPDGSRLHTEDDGSTGEKERKNREERLKLMKERQEQEHERRLAELKAAYEKESRVRQLKDAERLRRIQEIKMKETQRRHAVEERRRRLETEDKEKREQILAKYKEYEHRFNSQRDQKKPIYAFGSSTPRTLAYLEHLDNSMRVYNSRLGSAGGADEDSSTASAKGASSAEKRATSACSLTRKPLTASSSPNLSPAHQQQYRAKFTSGVHHPPPRSTKNVLAPSGRWGGSMVASMYGGSVASSAATHSHVDRDPLANAHSMTTSFAVGDTSAFSPPKNVRTKGTLSPAATARSQSTTRLARTVTTSRKPRQPDVNSDAQKSTATASKRNGSDGDGAPTAAGIIHKAKGVSSARTPSAPPPSIRRPVGDTVSKNVAPPAASKAAVATKEKPKSGAPSTSLAQKQQQQAPAETEPVKIIRKPKPAPETSTPERATMSPPNVTSTEERRSPVNFRPEESIVSAAQDSVDVSSIRLDDDHLSPYEPDNISAVLVQEEYRPDFEPLVVDNVRNDSSPQPPVLDEQHISIANQNDGLLAFSLENAEMTASMAESVSNVPKPTGQGAGKVLSKEEATAALAERRRLAREQMEREKELERQREEQRRLEEEEAIRREEEEFRRQEQEELRALEEARQLEEERIRKMIEEEETRRIEETKQREEEQRKRTELEARAREEADKAERERKDAEEKFKKDELERSERKKRLEAIMQRTRQAGGTPGATSTPIGKQQQGGGSGQIFVNGSNELGNDSIYATPDAPNASFAGPSSTQTSSASSAVLKKLANVRPEVGRSLENILNRVKSTPNVSDVEHAGATNIESALTPSVMTTSFSADKVSHTPANGDVRLTQSFYATPAARFDNSFNYAGVDDGGARTEYDIDSNTTKSESHYARILSNQNATGIETGAATAALSPIPGIDSNANQQNRSNTVSSSIVPDFGEHNFFDHNDNRNGAAAAASNGHVVERASASDSDASSAVTVINQKVSPNDAAFDDPFSSPHRPHNTFDLINDNVSTPDGINQPMKVVQSTASHQERPLMDF